ncbi:MAG: PQQ-binding-like beta-propeller repeat protein [Candidatus Nealsonbacteria bacterium]|nr:PQQ-binding-like beta-propeller repeat protein [Candidatus Nealsonbacteria bacterium]
MTGRALILILLVLIMAGLTAAASAADVARDIIADGGFRGGLVVHLGCADGRRTVALHAAAGCLVHGLDTDAASVAKAREHIRSRGLYGKVSVAQFDGRRLPYVDNLVNLVVAEDLGDVKMDEIIRVLAPLGVAHVKQNEKWQKTVKQRPEGIDEWTHYLYNASGNAVSADRLVGPTRHLKWVAAPLWSRSHEYTPSMAAMVSAGGRIFSIHDDGVRGVIDRRVGDRWMVHARDAFNGLLLWRRPMSEDWGAAAWNGPANWSTPMSIPRRLVASGDRIYVTLGYRSPVTVLNAVTGELIRELANTRHTDEMVLLDKTLLVRRRKLIPDYSAEASAWKVQLRRGQEMPAASPGDETIAAIDVDTGKTLWQWEDTRIVTLSLSAWQGRVCYHNFEELVCLDLPTGKLLWRMNCPSWPDLVETSGTLVMYEDMVFYAADRGLHAFDATSGELLWKGPRICRTGIRHTADLLIADGLLWSGITPDMPTGNIPKEVSPFAVPGFSGVVLQGLDPRSGQVKRRVDIQKLISDGHHIRCYRSKGTDRYLMWPKRGTEFVDVVDGKNHTRTDWLRGECSYGVMPSDGLVFAPPHPCICSPGVKLDGFFAGSARPVTPEASEDDQRLRRGPAYVSLPSPSGRGAGGEGGIADKSNSDLTSPHPAAAPPPSPASGRGKDWPMYRHDVARSGATQSAVASHLTTRWKKQLGGKLTQGVIVGGRVFVASVDQHTLYALDADDGRTAWSYVASGRIDSAPTVSDGRVLFGSHDGWVYCLRASDGELAWRFRAAPVEARLTAFGQLESPWPVLGSVLIHRGAAYVSAGRSSYLDGGMYLYGLDVKTGAVVHHRHLEGPWPDISKDVGQPYAMMGVKPDLFTCNGTLLSMGPHEYKMNLADHREFKPDGETNTPKSDLHLMASSGFLDDTWHDRTLWTHSRAWPGRGVFSAAHIAPKSGQIIVFDESTTYSIKAFLHKTHMSPMHVPGEGYGLIADANDNEPGRNFARMAPPRWKALVPIRARGLVLADDTLFLAGCRDVIAEDDPTAAYEGRGPSLLWAVSAADGTMIEEYELDAPPVGDGMSAAGGKLYISSTEGTVTCLAGRGIDAR